MKIQSLYIEITNQCNLNCRTCYNRSGYNRQRRELSACQIEQIITLFLPYGLQRVLLSGGEPTLHTEFDSILDLADRYPQLTFAIATNGTNASQKLIDCLNTRKNLSLQVSLDGSDEEQNAAIRGTGHFEEVISFARQIHSPCSKPLLKMVVSRSNIADVENFCNLALSIGFTPELAFLYRSGNGLEHWESRKLSPQQKLQVLKLIDRINATQNADIFLPLCTDSCPFTGDNPNLSLCIKTDGSIQPCQMLYDSTFTLGNVLSFDEPSFWDKLSALSDLARKRLSRDYGCAKCLLNGHCGKGCMAEAFQLHGNPLAADDSCSYRKLQLLYHDINPQLLRNEDAP